ncbi:unnamed protein product [marine sediment metagenome]|uniref:Uncharacterized protein n=1 Tax=marine sediment metagenome TaxID=412755 RepID=X1BXC8_9ZZZZ
MGFGYEENHPKTQVSQEPEITEEPQKSFGYKTADGTKKEFPGTKPGKIPGEDIPF